MTVEKKILSHERQLKDTRLENRFLGRYFFEANIFVLFESFRLSQMGQYYQCNNHLLFTILYEKPEIPTEKVSLGFPVLHGQPFHCPIHCYQYTVIL